MSLPGSEPLLPGWRSHIQWPRMMPLNEWTNEVNQAVSSLSSLDTACFPLYGAFLSAESILNIKYHAGRMHLVICWSHPTNCCSSFLDATAFVCHLSHSVSISVSLSFGILNVMTSVDIWKPSQVSSCTGRLDWSCHCMQPVLQLLWVLSPRNRRDSKRGFYALGEWPRLLFLRKPWTRSYTEMGAQCQWSNCHEGWSQSRQLTVGSHATVYML